MPASEQDCRFGAFGTEVRVLVSSPTPLEALRVQALFARLHRTLTRFDPGSELSRLNARPGRDVAVSTMLLRAVEAALWAARASDGLV
ncbi:MAG: FAD:protein FMN transferase, partial [Solirubrobacteraceae bacterium]